MLRKLWHFFTRNQVRTWWAHSAIAWIAAAIASPWGIVFVSKVLWTVALCYLVKEILDIFKHLAYATDPL